MTSIYRIHENRVFLYSIPSIKSAECFRGKLKTKRAQEHKNACLQNEWTSAWTASSLSKWAYWGFQYDLMNKSNLKSHCNNINSCASWCKHLLELKDRQIPFRVAWIMQSLSIGIFYFNFKRSIAGFVVGVIQANYAINNARIPST